MSKTMLFFGTEEFSAMILRGLLDAGFTVDAVVTKPDSISGRGQKVVAPAVKTLAIEHSIPVLQPGNLLDIVDDIKAFGKPAGVLASYGKIVPQAILDLFEPGIINVHPSLLPKYRGASPIESAILNGDQETGVSIMQLVAEMDAGPVYAQATIALDGTETAENLYSTLAQKGSELLIQHLPAIVDGSLQPTQQAGEPTYCSKITKADGIIDWQQSAAQIERQIRAYHEWPQSRTTLGNNNNVEVIITKAHVEQSSNTHSPYPMLTGKDFLVIDTLKPVGKKEMPIEAFLAGYRAQL